MNKSKRAALGRASAMLSSACSIVESVLSREEASYDNLPEGIQGCEVGCAFENVIDLLEDAISGISDATEKISLAAQ